MARMTLWLFLAVAGLGTALMGLVLALVFGVSTDPDRGVVLFLIPCSAPLVIGCAAGAITIVATSRSGDFKRWERVAAWAGVGLALFACGAVLRFCQLI